MEDVLTEPADSFACEKTSEGLRAWSLVLDWTLAARAI